MLYKNRIQIKFSYLILSYLIRTLIILVQDKNTSLKLPVGVSLLQLVKFTLKSEIFRHKTSHMVLPIIFLEDKHKILLHLSIFYEYQQFFQHRICFSIQPQLQLVYLHNRRYFVIKLHTWFCLSYFLKTNIKCYCIYQYL